MAWKKNCRKFLNLKMIRLPQDIFNLNFKEIEKLDGWGQQSVANLRYAIEEKKMFPLRDLYILLV